jgi:hypothetical protein
MQRHRPATLVASALACSLGALAWTGPSFAGGGSCCPSDLNGDGVVGPVDLATVLGAWGACTTQCSKTMVIGRIILPTRSPAAHAAVTSSLGGQGTSGDNGYVAFEIAAEGGSATLTATVTINNVAYVATKVIGSIVADGVTEFGELMLTPAATCPGTWQPSLGAAGIFDGTVRCITIFDDHSGSGPAIFAGGLNVISGDSGSTSIAKWNGTGWVQTGPQVIGSVSDMVVHDDGSGLALYASGVNSVGGLSTGEMARWNGSQWSALGGPFDNTINDLEILDDGKGTGPQLYAGGQFQNIGGVPASRVARWDGQAWHAIGAGLPGSVLSLAVFDDGSGNGPELYAAGGVTIPGSIAKWNGSSWVPVGTGLNASVRSLTVFDDGTGPALYAGGGFTSAGGQPAFRVARWKNLTWSAVGSGVGSTFDNEVRTLAPLVDQSTGERFLYAGGNFTQAGGVPATRFARWNGQTWSALGANFDAQVTRIAPLDPGYGGGNLLFVIGSFITSPSGDPSLARWGCVPTPTGR